MRLLRKIVSQKPETRFKERVKKHLRKLPETWLVKIQQVVILGTPDILCCCRGQFVALELKRDKKAEISAMQILELKRIEKAGGISLVTYPENWEDCLEYLRLLAEKGTIKNVKTNFRPFA